MILIQDYKAMVLNWEYLFISRSISDCHNSGGRWKGFIDICMVENRDATQHPTMHKTIIAKNYLTQHVSDVEVKNPWSK